MQLVEMGTTQTVTSELSSLLSRATLDVASRIRMKASHQHPGLSRITSWDMLFVTHAADQ